jgi:hypothetical protein
MKLSTFARTLPAAVLFGALLIAPVVHRDGQLWLIAAAAALAAYYGMTARSVYGATAVLLVTDVLYGGFVGSTSVAFIGAVLAALFVRRYISLPVWANRDGWRVGDVVRTLLLAWFICAGTVLLSVLVGDALYGFGRPWTRIAGIASPAIAFQPLVVSALVCIVVRRVTIPFRRAILFGT